MATERPLTFSQGDLTTEIREFAGYNTFSFCSNGNRALVSVLPTGKVSQVASFVRDEFYRGSQDAPISYSAINTDYWLLIAGHGVRSLNPPEQNSAESQALYVARGEYEGGVLLVQVLDRFQRTSHHFHKEARPEVYSGDGSLLIWKEERDVIPVETMTVIEPKVSHVGFTLEKPAITYIFNYGEDLDHQPMSYQPSMEFLIDEARKAGYVSDKAYAEFQELQSAS